MNWIGVVAALTAFCSIWFGHVAVRKIESISSKLWIPSTIFVVLGLAVEFLSLFAANHPISTALGIFGITLLWDAVELTRQQQRIVKGHAPANPNNPRHAKILEEYAKATTQDLLKREPVGQGISTDESNHLISNL